jgi:hypothetical protein
MQQVRLLKQAVQKLHTLPQGLVITCNKPVMEIIKVLTCICLRRCLFRVTLEISRTVIRDVTAGTLTATDTYALRMHTCGRG